MCISRGTTKLLRLALSNNNAYIKKYNIATVIHLQTNECITSVAELIRDVNYK